MMIKHHRMRFEQPRGMTHLSPATNVVSPGPASSTKEHHFVSSEQMVSIVAKLQGSVAKFNSTIPTKDAGLTEISKLKSVAARQKLV